MLPPAGPRPAIPYPCAWTYQLIGPSEAALRAHVSAVLGEGEGDHDVQRSRTSSQGGYVSLRLRLVVRDEAHRLSLHRRLAAAACVRLVR